MSTSNTNSSNRVIVSPLHDIAIPYIGRFWLYLISNVLSLSCCLFVLFHLLSDRNLRHALHNHVIIVLLLMCLICELTDIPFIINVYLFGVVSPQSPTFCLIWKFIDSCIYTSTAKLTAWASVERHILIFHYQWISTKRKRLLLHYIPLLTIILYGILCYAITTPINDCNRQFYYTSVFCGYYSCVYNSVSYTLYEFMTGAVLCSFLIGTGSISLIIRVVYRRRRFHRHVQWRKHRRMTIQLLSIVSIFFILYLPQVLLAIAKKCGVSSSIGNKYNLYAQFFSFYVIFLIPFACIGTLPKLRTRIKKLFRCCYRQPAHAIVSEQIPMQPIQK